MSRPAASPSRRMLILLLALVGCLTAALLPAAVAAPAASPYAATLERTVAYLQRVQNADGGFPGTPGGASDFRFSAWIAIALAAAGINPQDQAAPGGGVDAWTYLVRNAGRLSSETTEYERAMLAVVATGADPRDFAGRDLVASILERQLPDGSFPLNPGGRTGGVNVTAFAILPLSTVAADPGVRAAIERAADWLLTAQREDGSWPVSPGQPGDTDVTAAAIEALRVVGRPDTAQERRAWAFVRARQGPGGGFGAGVSLREENTATTAWVAQAMWAAGVDPATWASAAGRTPLDFLAGMQQPDGSIKWKAGEDRASNMNPVWMTAYALPALTGNPLPVPAVPRAARVPDPPAGDGGVTSGGGGEGAPLFTRPQGQSDGEAAGGVRRVRTRPRTAAELLAARRRAEREPTAPARRPAQATTRRAPGARRVATGTAQSNGSADRGVTPVASRTRTPGGTATDGPAPAQRAPASPAAGQEVTGRLLGRAPAGVSGTGPREGVAPGLRSAPPDPGSSAVAVVLAVLLAAATLAGARLEGAAERGALIP